MIGKVNFIRLAICPSGCDHGSCTMPNTCTCNQGWTGISCSVGLYSPVSVHDFLLAPLPITVLIPEHVFALDSYESCTVIVGVLKPVSALTLSSSILIVSVFVFVLVFTLAHVISSCFVVADLHPCLKFDLYLYADQ
jgi:hypothetical protein